MSISRCRVKVDHMWTIPTTLLPNGQRTDIIYGNGKGEIAAATKTGPGDTGPLDSSREDTLKNVDRQISLEFDTVPVQRKEQ